MIEMEQSEVHRREKEVEKLNELLQAYMGAVHNLRLQIEVGGWSAKCKRM